MKGTQGHVTLRLAEPIRFESITIDHHSLSSTTTTAVSSESAPRYFEIIGYPPSSSDSLGFDTKQGKLLSAFEFDPTKSSSDTFTTTTTTLPTQDSGERVDDGSCSVVKPTCEEPPLVATEEEKDENGFLVAGIQIRIIGNWGNPDYTCFYRARLQGSTDHHSMIAM